MFKICLFRSHFSNLAIGAITIYSVGNQPTIEKSGWSTRFDGGANKCGLGDLISIFADAGTSGNEPAMYARYDRQWGSTHHKVVLLRHKQLPKEIIFDQDGLNLVESVHLSQTKVITLELPAKLFDNLVETGPKHVNSADWEVVTEVPEKAGRALLKTAKTLSRLFGQGNDFF